MLFLEIYPNSAIEIFVEVVAADGGTRCASTTAAALALADAGIPMRDLITGVAIGLVNDHIALDLNDFEDKAGDADIPCGFVVREKKLALLQFDGNMTPDQILQAIEMAHKGASEIYAKQQAALREKYQKIRETVNPPGSTTYSDDDEGEDQPYGEPDTGPGGEPTGQPPEQPRNNEGDVK
jgi:exosome complex component RRP41